MKTSGDSHQMIRGYCSIPMSLIIELLEKKIEMTESRVVKVILSLFRSRILYRVRGLKSWSVLLVDL